MSVCGTFDVGDFPAWILLSPWPIVAPAAPICFLSSSSTGPLMVVPAAGAPVELLLGLGAGVCPESAWAGCPSTKPAASNALMAAAGAKRARRPVKVVSSMAYLQELKRVQDSCCAWGA
ncbi:hypothetical protein SCMU_26050 [Sinomonas cyclohexanicum]|uniref:Uncharacterized protein n=1 Tax=Sinomonas cyclohexanicum TaxID=322009 RepID=A0ABN6FLT0_SINCY|nr:hypothetical protein SCMU_26050 [Corynebacterium cyclohexanicum]